MKGAKEKFAKTMLEMTRNLILQGPGIVLFNPCPSSGKTHNFAYLATTDFPKHYKQIFILTIQTKLSEEFIHIIYKQVNKNESKISKKEILFCRSNLDTIREAYENQSLNGMINEITHWIDKELQENSKALKILSEIKEDIKYAKRQIDKHIHDTNIYDEQIDETLPSLLSIAESNLRSTIRSFYHLFKNIQGFSQSQTEKAKESFLQTFPCVSLVFPQVTFDKKKVVICTIHKLLKGIDPIMSRRFKWIDLTDKNSERCIIFDESDVCFQIIREHLIEKAVNRYLSNDSMNYNSLLEVFSIIELRNEITNVGFGPLAKSLIDSIRPTADEIWEEMLPGVPRYRNIFIDKNVDKNKKLRRGLFLIGIKSSIKVSYTDRNLNSYITYNEGDTHLTICYAKNSSDIQKEYKIVISIETFIIKCLKLVRSFINKAAFLILKEFEKQEEIFRKKLTSKPSEKENLTEEVTIENITISLFSKLNTISQKLFIDLTLDRIYNLRRDTSNKNETFNFEQKNLFYSYGYKFVEEKITLKDYDKSVDLRGIEVSPTAEEMVLSLDNGKNTIVLSSATAGNPTIIGNGDIKYIKSMKPVSFRSLTNKDHNRISRELKATYPSNHKIHVKRIGNIDETDLVEYIFSSKISLPEYYKKMFHPSAVKAGHVDHWFKITMRLLKLTAQTAKDPNKKINKIKYQLNRILQFIEVYYEFTNHDDIRSMIFFQNNGPKNHRPNTINMAQQMQIISCLIDGTYKKKLYCPTTIDDELPLDWQNPHLFLLKEWDDVKIKVIPGFEKSTKTKTMLVTAYNSIKAGCNLQYKVPPTLKVLKGDFWPKENDEFLKDWDAVYIQLLSNYMSKDDTVNKKDKWKEILKIMLYEGMFYVNKYHEKKEVERIILNAMYSDTLEYNANEPRVFADKSAWMFGVYNQSISRISRERIKNLNTYIFYDSKIEGFSTRSVENISKTPEFEAFINTLKGNASKSNIETSPEDIILYGQATTQYNSVKRELGKALRYCDRKNKEYIPGTFYSESEKENRIETINARKKIRELYIAMAKNPTIPTEKDVPDVLREYMGLWKRNESNECWFYTNTKEEGSVCIKSPDNKDIIQTCVSPESTRLSIMRKNPIIRKYFEEHGYALDWEPGLMLHPNFMVDIYPGIIGELACMAILLHYTNCRPEDIVEMIEDENHEVVDIVIKNRKTDKYILGIDAKNLNPYFVPYDRPQDLDSITKHNLKVKRLDCRVVTVNIVQMEGETSDAANEILGLIDKDGNPIMSNIMKLNQYLKANEND